MDSNVRSAFQAFRSEFQQCCDRLESSILDRTPPRSPMLSPRSSNPYLSPRGNAGMALTSIAEDSSVSKWAPVLSDPLLLPPDLGSSSDANKNGHQLHVRPLRNAPNRRSSQIVAKFFELRQHDAVGRQALPSLSFSSPIASPALSFGTPSNSREVSIPGINRRSQIVPGTLRHIHHAPVEQEENGSVRGAEPFLRSCIASDRFDYIGTLFIASYAIFLGFETDYRAKYWMEQLPTYCIVAEAAFSAIFMLELSLRFIAFGRDIFHVQHGSWNLFDCIVIGVPFIAETISTCLRMTGMLRKSALHDHVVNVVRAMRVVRLVRTLRLLRVVRMLKELHIIANSMMMAVKSLLWTVVLLALWTCIAGIVLTSTVTDYKVRMDRNSPAVVSLENNFGSVQSTLLMLYLSVSQGKEWAKPYYVLTEENDCTVPGIVFLVYVTTTIFGIMNIFTSLFVKAVHETSIETKRDFHLENIAAMFEGSVNQASFEKSLEDSRMRAYFHDIDLSVEDGAFLFDLLDADENGEISIEEFGSGCVRLHGYAKAIDLEFLGKQHRAFTARFEQHATIVEKQLSILAAGREGIRLAK